MTKENFMSVVAEKCKKELYLHLRNNKLYQELLYELTKTALDED